MGVCFSKNSAVTAPEKTDRASIVPAPTGVEARGETVGFSPTRRIKGLVSRVPSRATLPDNQFSVRGINPRRIQYSKTDKETAELGQADVKALLYSTVSYACKKGMKPESPNQDDFCIYFNEGVLFCGVFDGHGKV
jgi:hypothetical protein